MHAEVGDQLVGPGRGVCYGELLGEIVGVLGEGGAGPYLVRWYEFDTETVFDPDPERYWIASAHQERGRTDPRRGHAHRGVTTGGAVPPSGSRFTRTG